MGRRVRASVTIREDEPVPRRRTRKKSNNKVVVFILLALVGLYLISHYRGGTRQPQPSSFVRP